MTSTGTKNQASKRGKTRTRSASPKNTADRTAAPKSAGKTPTRLDQLQELITREEGACIAEMVEATGWQPHSVRGALAGALKKRSLNITSEKIDGVRRYYADVPASAQ